jgi:hypothetical protein
MVARKIMRILRDGGKGPFSVRVNPRLGSQLREDSHLVKAVLRENGVLGMTVVDDPALPCEQFKVLSAE